MLIAPSVDRDLTSLSRVGRVLVNLRGFNFQVRETSACNTEQKGEVHVLYLSNAKQED